MTGIIRPTGSRRRLIGLALAMGAAVAFIAGGLVQLRIETGVDTFIPSGNRVAEATEQVASSFGGDPIVVLLESDEPYVLLSKDNLPSLLRLEGELAQLDNVAAVYGPATVLNQIAGRTQTILAELSGYRDGLRAKAEREARDAGKSAKQIKQAGQQATAEFDERYATLLARGLPGGLPTLVNQKFVQNVVFTDAGAPRPQWDFVVPTPAAVAVLIRPRQDLGQASVERLVGQVRAAVDPKELGAEEATVSGVPAVVAALGQQVRQEAVWIGAVALLGVGSWFVFIGWTRRRFRLLPLATTLIGTAMTLAIAGWLSLPVSLGVVAFLPVLLGVGSDFMTYLHRHVERRTVIAAAAATSAAFGALVVTPIPAVRELGVALGIGVLITLAVSLLVARYLPTDPTLDGQEVSRGPAIRSAPSVPVRIGAGIAAIAVAAIGWASLPSLSLQADFRSLASELSAFDEAKHVEDVLGSSGEIAITLTGDDTVTKETLAWMREAQSAIIAANGDTMHPIISPPLLFGFLGDSPSVEQLEAALTLLPPYLTTSVIRSDQEMTIMSFGVQLDDAAQLLALRDETLKLLPPAPEGIDVTMTGLPMVAVAGYEALATDRYVAAGLGIVAAGLVLLVALRRRSDALRAVIAASLTSGFVILCMSILGIGLNPLTAAVGSLTAAVACEFTVVLAEGARRHDPAIRKAVLLAAAASATGYGVLVISDLSMISDFGLLLAATVGLAVLTSHLVVWLTMEDVADDESKRSASEQPHHDLIGAHR